VLGLTVPGMPSTPSEPATSRPITTGEQVDITDPGSVVERLGDAVTDLANSMIAQVPLILLGTVVFVLGLLLVGLAHRGVVRATTARRADPAVARLIQVMTRIALVLLVSLLALSVAGVDVGSALAALGLAGLAIAFAIQSILENFIAGILILIRRPFRPGDQVRLGDYEGTVSDVNMRVTTLLQFDGEKVLLPNALVFNEPITNTTERGRRRSVAVVGVDYRNDHDRARELLLETVQGVEGVLPTPAPRVLLGELNESSVDFRLLYWTLPEQAEVNGVRDRVLGAAKSAIEDAGMTIPWPIRTLVLDPESREALRSLTAPGDAAPGHAAPGDDGES
jgi:small conductance mechanosensitive channel